MKKLLYIFLFFSSASFTQNLIPNFSFEQYSTCPWIDGQIDYAPPWFNPTQGTPDYYNACYTTGSWNVDVPANWIGYQNGKTGIAYSGISVSTALFGESREYIEIKLFDSLQAGIKYYISFHVSLSDSVRYATDDIGAYLSKDSVFSSNYLHLPDTPQVVNTQGNVLMDRQNWIQISGEYIAQGGEKYLTIGNFKNDQNTDTVFVSGGAVLNNPNYNTVYYYIDDVCVSNNPDTCNILTSTLSSPVSENNFLFYPNPVKNFLVIKYNQKKILELKFLTF